MSVWRTFRVPEMRPKYFTLVNSLVINKSVENVQIDHKLLIKTDNSHWAFVLTTHI